MSNKGFIMIDRSILEDEMYFSEKFTRMQALMDLCLLAAFKSRTFYIRGNKVELQPMQVAKSIRDLADRWQWGINKVRSFILELEKSGIIDTQKTSVIQIITIKKYVVMNTQTDTQTDTPIIKNNNVNNENKEIVIEDKSSLSVSTDEQPTTTKKKSSGGDKVPKVIIVGDKQIVTAELLAYWNSAMEGRVIKQINRITEKRAKFIKIRLSNFTPEEIFKAIDKAAISDFLNGRIGNRGWTADFDWMFGNESNFIKVLEGRYDNVATSTQTSLFPTTTSNNNGLTQYNNGTIQQQFGGTQSYYTKESEQRVLGMGQRGFDRAFQAAMRDVEKKHRNGQIDNYEDFEQV